MELIYKATVHGCAKTNVWDKIQDRENLLVVVKTEHGRILGGYI